MPGPLQYIAFYDQQYLFTFPYIAITIKLYSIFLPLDIKANYDLHAKIVGRVHTNYFIHVVPHPRRPQTEALGVDQSQPIKTR